MPGPAEILKEAHRLMRYVSELDAKLAGGPKSLKSAQLALKRHEDALKAAQDELKHDKVHIHEKEVSVKQQQQHIEKLEKTSVSNKKEYDALRVEIANVQKSIRGVEDQILELMGAVEEKQARIPALEKSIQQGKADLARIEKDNEEKLGRFASERATAKAQLAEIEKTIPPMIEARYKQLVAALGVEAMAAVQNRNCLACYTEITQQMQQELGQGQFVVCKNCDRMLYLA